MSHSLTLVSPDVSTGSVEVCAASRDRVFQPSISGLVILDHLGDPIYFNNEAVTILAYPETNPAPNQVARLVRDRISSWLGSAARADPQEFNSGRRRYVVRIVPLSSMTASSAQATTAILLERAQRRSFDSSQAAARFNLSQRERETVELLVHGYTSKEIASRMQISPNTVKTFVRLIMVKMGVSTRSGLVGKILTARLELSDQFS